MARRYDVSFRKSSRGKNHPIELLITDHTRLRGLPTITHRLKSILKRTTGRPSLLELQLVTDQVMAWMNREFRKKNGPTDVLTFPTYIWRTKVQPDKLLLGSIVIAPAFAERKWLGRRARSLEERTRLTQRLFRHGLNHIFGRHHKQ